MRRLRQTHDRSSTPRWHLPRLQTIHVRVTKQYPTARVTRRPTDRSDTACAHSPDQLDAPAPELPVTLGTPGICPLPWALIRKTAPGHALRELGVEWV